MSATGNVPGEALVARGPDGRAGRRSEAVATLDPADIRVVDLMFGRALSLAGVRVPLARHTIVRVREALREGYCAVALARHAREDPRGSCPSLAAIVEGLGEESSPRMRHTVLGHARRCAACRVSVHPALARALGPEG